MLAAVVQIDPLLFAKGENEAKIVARLEEAAGSFEKAIARGGDASFPLTDERGVEQLNEKIAANRRRLPLWQVVADLDFAREMVKQALLAGSDDMAMSRFQEIGPIGAGHEIEHAGLIESWRKEQGL